MHQLPNSKKKKAKKSFLKFSFSDLKKRDLNQQEIFSFFFEEIKDKSLAFSFMSHMNRPKDSPEPGLIPLPIGSSGTPLSQRSVPLPVSSPGSDPESCFSSPILSLLPSLSSLPPSSLSPHSDLLDSDNSEGSGRNVTKVLERNRSLTPQQLRSSPREFTPPHASKSSAPAVSFCHSSPIGIRSSPLSPSPSVQLRERERLHLPSSGAHRLRSSSPPKLPRNTMHLKLSHVPQLPPPLDNPPPGTRYPSENQIKTKELLSKLAHKTESETEERAILPPPFFCLPPLLCYSGDLSPDLSHDKKHFGRYNTSGGEVGGNIHEIFADG